MCCAPILLGELTRLQMRAFLLPISLAIALASGPGMAQTQRLPRVSPAERQVEDINRSIQRQQRVLQFDQQTQFEINQLRQDIQRERSFPLMTGPGSANCPPSSIGC